MGIWDTISAAFKPIADVIDNVHTSDEERMALKNAELEMKTRYAISVLEKEKAELEARQQVVMAEAQGQSWLQRTWRPITMLTFLGLVCADQFGLLTFRLSNQAWTLLQIGLGGYVVGRTAEKVTPKWADAVGKRKETVNE